MLRAILYVPGDMRRPLVSDLRESLEVIGVFGRVELRRLASQDARDRTHCELESLLVDPDEPIPFSVVPR